MIWRLIATKKRFLYPYPFSEPFFYRFNKVCIHFHLKIFQIPFPFFLFKFFRYLLDIYIWIYTHPDTLEHFCLSTMGNSKDLHTWRRRRRRWWRERVFYLHFGEKEKYLCVSIIYLIISTTPVSCVCIKLEDRRKKTLWYLISDTIFKSETLLDPYIITTVSTRYVSYRILSV